MMKTIVETINTEIKDLCEVLVAGGGFAGISAAMTDNFMKTDIKELQNRLMLAGVKIKRQLDRIFMHKYMQIS